MNCIRKYSPYVFLWIICFACGSKKDEKFVFVPSNDSISYHTNFYKRAEKMQYDVMVNLGKAAFVNLEVDTLLHDINGKTCYKTYVNGSLKGTASWFGNIEDTFISYADTASYLPKLFIRDIKEGRFVKYEKSHFDHLNKIVRVKDKSKAGADSVLSFPITAKMEDIISAFFHLRNIDFQRVAINDSLVLDVFLENKSYNLKVKYLGKETIKTKSGKQECFVLTPIMPANEFLKDEDPIKAYLSNDEKRIPMKIKVRSIFGAATVVLKKYQQRR